MKIEFVDYDGHYPNLCRGVLILRIDDKIYSFGGCHRIDRDFLSRQFYSFWDTGGGAWIDDNGDEHIEEGKWVLSEDAKLPDFLKGHEQELIDIMNNNVPYGCCGGCI